jgi:hypothetical protein
MQKVRLLVVALFAVFAFGAFAASSAFAEPELLGDEVALANESAVTSEGELELIDTKAGLFGEEAALLCSGRFDGLWLAAKKLILNRF